MSDQYDFTVKEIIIELKSDIKDFIKESKRRADQQDTKIQNLNNDVIKIKRDSKWASGIIALLVSSASWIANHFTFM